MSDRLAEELARRIADVERAAAHDPGFTPRDWLSLVLTAVAIPLLILLLGWYG